MAVRAGNQAEHEAVIESADWPMPAELVPGEVYVIGRSEKAHFCFVNDKKMSREHAEVSYDGGARCLRVRDRGSSNGVIVDGVAEGNVLLESGRTFRVGQTDLTFRLREKSREADSLSAVIARLTGPPVVPLEFRRRAHDSVSERLRQILPADEDDDRMLAAREEVLQHVLGGMSPPAGTGRADCERVLRQDLWGFGPLDPYLADDDVEEVMVNREDALFVAVSGQTVPVPGTFLGRDSLLNVITKIVAPLGKHVDQSSPYVDARLADGSRVNAIVPPLALDGPCLTIRKFPKRGLSANDLVSKGTLSEQMAAFLAFCVENRLNILVSGGTGSGKTTLLNALSNYIPEGQRIVTIEDVAELRLHEFHRHVVRLQARTKNIQGEGEVTIRELVTNALRMRPDRIVVGECRGGEALDMAQAMNTGHDGSLTTAHANSPRDALRRLEVMCMMAGYDLPAKAIREQLASAIHVIVQISRFTSDGSRKIVFITEVAGIQDETVTLQDIFVYKRRRVDPDGRVEGEFGSTGVIPDFVADLEEQGVKVDRGMFRKPA